MERGNLGDDLPPDYFTHIQEEGFYGFPYSYIGHHLDPMKTISLWMRPNKTDSLHWI
jgi:glucose/arabinose dehydrogenase